MEQSKNTHHQGIHPVSSVCMILLSIGAGHVMGASYYFWHFLLKWTSPSLLSVSLFVLFMQHSPWRAQHSAFRTFVVLWPSTVSAGNISFKKHSQWQQGRQSCLRTFLFGIFLSRLQYPHISCRMLTVWENIFLFRVSIFPIVTQSFQSYLPALRCVK